MTVQTVTLSVALDASDNPEPLLLAGAAVGYVTTRWVVVNNLTPYIMELEGVGDNNTNQAAVPPGTANKYPWTQKNGPLIANWTNPITGAPPSTPQVVVEYSDLPDGSDLSGTYPTTIASGVTIGTLTGSVTLTGPVTIDDVEGVVTIDPAPPGIIFGPTGLVLPAGVGLQVAQSVPITSSTRTLIIAGTTQSSAFPASNFDVEVTGDQSGLVYRPITPPYLFQNGKFQCVVPVSGIIDTSVTITYFNLTGTGNTITTTVAADNSEYTENIYYNGVARAAATVLVAPSTSLLKAGPCRLLSATLSTSAANAQMTLNGVVIANIPTATFAMPISFPDDTILDAGSNLSMILASGTAAEATLVFAYP